MEGALDLALDLARMLGEAGAGLGGELVLAREALSRADAALAEAIAAALAEELPLLKRDGGFVRPGHDAGLDEARALRDESRRVIAALQARYAKDTDCRALRVKHNNVLGYFVEVPQAVGERFLKEPISGQFVHRQTMAGAFRFSTIELGELERKIASAADRALAIELDVFARLVAMAETARPAIESWHAASRCSTWRRGSPNSPPTLAGRARASIAASPSRCATAVTRWSRQR